MTVLEASTASEERQQYCQKKLGKALAKPGSGMNSRAMLEGCTSNLSPSSAPRSCEKSGDPPSRFCLPEAAMVKQNKERDIEELRYV